MTTSLLAVTAIVAALWLVTRLAGFHMSLGSSLLLSIGLTLVLNLAMRGFRTRHRQH